MASFTPVVRVGCGCLVQSLLFPGKVLLGKRLGSHGAGKFALPGGHLEMGESWEDCLVREVKEETNLDVANLRLVQVTNDPNIDGNAAKHYITIFMSAMVSIDTSELANMEPHKCESWSWTTWEDIVQMRHKQPELLFEPMIHLIDGLEINNSNPFI